MSTDGTNASSVDASLLVNQGDRIIAVAILFAVLCTVFIALRFAALHLGQRSPSLEDWILAPAYVLMLGFCANVITSVIIGGEGRHFAYLTQFKPQAILPRYQTLFITQIFHSLVLPFAKTSILLLILRIFHRIRWLCYAAYILITYIWLWSATELLLTIFQCKPIAFQWDRSLGGTCVNQVAYFRAISALSTVHDLAMLILPLPAVWRLQLETRRKVALSGVFLVGSIGAIASIIRFALFIEYNALTDPTFTDVQLLSWTVAEPGIIFISACLPVLRPLIVRFASAAGLTSTNHSGSFELQQGSSGAPSGSYFRTYATKDDDTVSLTGPSSGTAKNNASDSLEVMDNERGYMT
ncbi:hypothetical protein FHL15_010703 [Xylaria flabelliformis]|uniref:Rhodopsin domain-containing protein n=1 Tax=Xylaria flabelliformis TaxID=2512241 RepID=A0A553HKB7_9PEZI|nr:hypothetical protein FHL15_010703 [Xylaria flabelliformis]